MKLASLKQGRDGRLVVVSRDLTRATDAFFVVPTLQAALDDWDALAPRLADLAEQLEHGSVPSFRFHEHDCASPLPRAYQWADGSAYVNHVELVRKARGAEMPALVLDRSADVSGRLRLVPRPARPDPAGRRGLGHRFRGGGRGRSPATSRWERTREEAAAAIRLVVLVNDVSLRNLIPAELAKGFGFFQSKPSSALSPVAVTPDELGEGLGRARSCTCRCSPSLNGQPFGRPTRAST